MQRDVLILSNCTGRKRHPALSQLRARSLPSGGYEFVANEWVGRVDRAEREHVAGLLYCGRAVTEVLRASELLGGDLLFVSAGLGLVSAQEKIPAYDLSGTPGLADSIAGRLPAPYLAERWWTALGDAMGIGGPVSRSIERFSGHLILIALPTGYLKMISNDLEGLTRSSVSKIRILGPRRAEDVPRTVRGQWLPYDSRLDSRLSGFSGTASDFPQRALHHFATEIAGTAIGVSIEEHVSLILQSLSPLDAYVRSRGITASDEEVLCAISQLWDKHKGRRGAILRELRSTKLIACEQSRFRRLVDQFEERRNGKR